jgi:rhodanese-related sulfurtransferase
MVEEAKKVIEEIAAEDAVALIEDDSVVIIDIRDVRELQREGKIPGSFHCPRGMLEFWIDPASPYHKDIFAQEKKFVFHCASGWRSALATHVAQRMGLKPVAHIDSGFSGWKEAGGPVEIPEK